MLHQLYVPYFAFVVCDELKMNPYTPDAFNTLLRLLICVALGAYQFVSVVPLTIGDAAKGWRLKLESATKSPNLGYDESIVNRLSSTQATPNAVTQDDKRR